MRGLGRRSNDDRQLLGRMFRWLDEGERLLRLLEASMPVVAANLRAGRMPTTGLSVEDTDAMNQKGRRVHARPCLACDALVDWSTSGLCLSCVQEWDRDGRTDRRGWIARKRAELSRGARGNA